MRTTIAHGKSRYQQKDSTLWGLASTWEMRLTGPIPRPERTLTTKQTKVIEPSDPDKPLPPIEPLPDEPLPEEPQPEEPQPEELLSPDVSSPEIEFPIAGVEDLSRMPAWIAWLIGVLGVGTLVGMVLRNALGSTESVISDTGTYKAALEDWSDAIYAAAGTARGESDPISLDTELA